jgi:hypothetical protein
VGGKEESSGELGHFWQYSIENGRQCRCSQVPQHRKLSFLPGGTGSLVFVGVDRLTDMERNWYMVVKVSAFLSLGTS